MISETEAERGGGVVVRSDAKLNNTCSNMNKGSSVPYDLNFLIHILF